MDRNRSDSLTRLALRVRDGDAQAFRRLYGELYPKIAAYVGRRVHDRADVEDLVSHVFTTVVDRIRQFDATRVDLDLDVRHRAQLRHRLLPDPPPLGFFGRGARTHH